MSVLRSRFTRGLHSSWRSVLRGLAGVRVFVAQAFVNLPGMLLARRRIEQQIATSEERFAEELNDIAAWSGSISIEDMSRFSTIEENRRNVIESKARLNLFGISLVFPIVFGGLDSLISRPSNGGGTVCHSIILILLLGAMGYFAAGGYCALSALRVGKLYIPVPRDLATDTPPFHVARLIWCLRQNERVTLIRSNAVATSYIAVRNGVFVMAVIVVLIVAPSISLDAIAHFLERL